MSRWPAIHTDPLKCVYSWKKKKNLWTLIKVSLKFSIKIFRRAFAIASGSFKSVHCPPPPHTHTHMQLSLGSEFRPFDLYCQRSWPIRSLNVNRRRRWTPSTVHYSALFLYVWVCVYVRVCQQVKSLSTGTTGTEWKDSNDWFYPFTPSSLRVFLSTSKLKSESESRLGGHKHTVDSVWPLMPQVVK